MAELQNSNSRRTPEDTAAKTASGIQSLKSINELSIAATEQTESIKASGMHELAEHDTEQLADSLRAALDGLCDIPFSPCTTEAAMLASLKNLREYLSTFFEQNLAPQKRAGFLADADFEVDFETLKIELESLYLEMQAVVIDQDHSQESAVDYAPLAQHCAELLMNFLNEFDAEFRSGAFSEGARERLLLEVLNLRAGVTSVICELQEAEFQLSAETEQTVPEGFVSAVADSRSDSLLSILTGELIFLQEIAKDIYRETASFIIASRRIEPRRIGFQQSGQVSSELQSAALLNTLAVASQEVQDFFAESLILSSSDLQLQVFAQNIQTAADMLRLSLVRSDSVQTVAEADRYTITAAAQRAQSMVAEQSIKMSSFLNSLQSQHEAA